MQIQSAEMVIRHQNGKSFAWNANSIQCSRSRGNDNHCLRYLLVVLQHYYGQYDTVQNIEAWRASVLTTALFHCLLACSNCCASLRLVLISDGMLVYLLFCTPRGELSDLT